MADNVTEVMISVRRKPDDIVLYVFTFSLVLRDDAVLCTVRFFNDNAAPGGGKDNRHGRIRGGGAEGPSTPGRKI